MSTDLPAAPAVSGRLVDARLHLLDRQVHDRDGLPVTAVDDLDLSGPADHLPGGGEPPRVIALLAGAVLATRLFGGHAPLSQLHRIDAEHVTHVGTVLDLDVPGDDLPVTWTERWVRDRIIGRIPGGHHDPH
jgi:hypothetical protein